MATEGKEKPKTRLVICPECDTENDLEKEDECSKCGLNLELLFTKHRYNRALRRLSEREEQESHGGKKKKGGFNPFD